GLGLAQQVDVHLEARQSSSSPLRGLGISGSAGEAVARQDKIGCRVEVEGPAGAVYKDAPTGPEQPGELAHLTDHRDAETARQDSGVALRSAVLDNDAGQAPRIDGEQLHHRRLVREQHELLVAGCRGPPLARAQLPEQTMKDILDIENALLEV